MKQSQLQVRSQAIWYILWSALSLISAGNALAPYPIFSANLGFVVSLLLAAIAAIQLLRGVKFLSQKEIVLAGALLIVFGTEQLGQWVRMLVPPSMYRGFDFSAYYLAAKVMSETPGQGLYYLPLYADGRMDLNVPAPMSSPWHTAALHYNVPFSAPFIYPPFFAALMKPFAHLSFASAYFAWEIITVLLLAGAVLFSLSVANVRISRKLALILSVGLFSYFPFREGLFMGQIGCLILFLLAAGVWLLARNQTSLSALSFAVATMIKLTPILAVPLLIFHRRWKWLAAYAGWICALLIVSVWQAGWTMHQQFWHVVLPSISCGSPVCQNSSVVAYVQEIFLGYVPIAPHAPLTIPPYACAVSRSVAFMVYSLMLVRFYLRRHDGELVRDLVIMALLGIAVSPISWWHHYTLALLPFLYLWCTMPGKGDRTLLTLFIVVGTNVVGYCLLLAENHAAQMILSAIVPCLTIALVYLRLAPRQEPPINVHSALLPCQIQPQGTASFPSISNRYRNVVDC